METFIDRLTDKILHNQLLCSFTHWFVGAGAAILFILHHEQAAKFQWICFFLYELSQQYSRKKDHADVELRESIIGFWTIYISYLITSFF